MEFENPIADVERGPTEEGTNAHYMRSANTQDSRHSGNLCAQSQIYFVVNKHDISFPSFAGRQKLSNTRQRELAVPRVVTA